MKICPVCKAELNDEAAFCTQCGAPQGRQAAPDASENPAQASAQPQANSGAAQYGNPQPAAAVTYVDPFDHTKEFDAKDISDNKVVAMLTYLMGWIGIVIALLASKDSKYAAFHARQAMKMEVISILLALATVLLVWTFIIPFAGAVCLVIVFVLRIISFCQVCCGKAKEPAIIRALGFLK